MNNFAIYNHGVIIGKFLPPHNGHGYLIRCAMEQSKNITLFVCSLPTEHPSGAMRVQWLRHLFPTINIIHIPDANPAAARNKPNAINIWAKTIQSKLLTQPQPVQLAKTDALFASEEYGRALSQALSCQCVIVDQERSVVPVHARNILRRPLHYWQYMPQVVRAYFVCRILILASSKIEGSTLGQWMARYFNTHLVPDKLSTKDSSTINLRHVAAHIANEEALAYYANKILFTFTDARLGEFLEWQQHLTNYTVICCPQIIYQKMDFLALLPEKVLIISEPLFSNQQKEDLAAEIRVRTGMKI